MPDKRTHRGAHPADQKLFATDVVESLRQAIADYSLLLTKGYGEKSSLKLVCDKFALRERQRLAVMRCACSEQQLDGRKSKQADIDKIAGEAVVIDGYNVLITVEAGLSEGVIFEGRDGCFKDLASIHGTYRHVTETVPAIELIGQVLEEAKSGRCIWLLDKPVSNSGRLKKIIDNVAAKRGWEWEVRLSISPDKEAIMSELITASSDGIILDGCRRWVNLARAVIEKKVPQSWLIKLS